MAVRKIVLVYKQFVELLSHHQRTGIPANIINPTFLQDLAPNVIMLELDMNMHMSVMLLLLIQSKYL